MYITWINSTNMEFFAGGLLEGTQAKADILIGAITEEDERACGVLAAEVQERQINILSMFVNESDRRKGAGRQMLTELFTYGTRAGFDAVKISYADTLDMGEINQFFAACGMQLMESEQDFLWKVPSGALSIYAPENLNRLSQRIITLDHFGNRFFRSFNELVTENKEVILAKDTYDGELSCGFFDETNKCVAGILVKKGEGMAEARILLSEDASLDMVKLLLKRMVDNDPAKRFYLLIPVSNPEVKDILESFAAKAKIESYKQVTWFMVL